MLLLMLNRQVAKRWMKPSAFLVLSVVLAVVLTAAAPSAMANDPLSVPVLTLSDNPDGTQSYSMTLQILAIMTAFSFIPAALLAMTSFIRITIVFGILRQAIGLQQTPSNQIIIGLSLFLTFFIMTPVFQKVNETALQPYLNEELDPLGAAKAGVVPFRSFMLAQTRQTDMDLFTRIAGEDTFTADEVPMRILIPSFITSELKTAFQIGFLLFIPFLIIDLVVASVLMAMGMMMLSPMIVSLPFKIMLFVFVDGWAMIVGTLASSFGV